MQARDQWSATSPQHMPESIRKRVLPDEFLDGSFSIVRHPSKRLKSIFLFQRDIESRIPTDATFGDWLATIPQVLANDPFALDGHLRPMVQTVPETAKVFRLEEGLDRVLNWLDDVAGDTDGPREVAPANVFATRMDFKKRTFSDFDVTSPDHAMIEDIYQDDFARFGYDTLE